MGGVNKEGIFRSTKRPHEGMPRVSLMPTKVSNPPNDLTASDGHRKATLIVERKVLTIG